MTYVRRFGAFLYDFLVGDAWELFLGPIALLVVGWALVSVALPAALVGLVLVVGVVAIAAGSVRAALRGAG